MANNIVTTKNTLDVDGTTDISNKLNALRTAEDNEALYNDMITVRTRLSNELIAAQAAGNTAEVTRLNDEIQNWSDTTWADLKILEYATDVIDAQQELADARQFEYRSNIDWNRAKLEHLSRTDEAGLATLKKTLVDGLKATLPPLEEACTHETEIRDRIKVKYDAASSKKSTLQADFLQAERDYNTLNGQACVNTFFYQERLEFFSDEQVRLQALEADVQKLLDGDSNVVPITGGTRGLGLTTGLTDLLATANTNRTTVCDRVTEVNRVIGLYEAYSYDGGEAAVVDPITISYTRWGAIQYWSSYSPDLSAYDPSCAETEPKYTAAYNKLMVDPENADKRAEFTTCTGVAVPAPAFGKTIPDYQQDAANDVTAAEGVLAASKATIASLTVTINEKIAEELRLRNLATQQRADYAIRVTAAHLHAETCPPLLNPIPGFEAEIVRLETVITDETIVLATKW